MVDRDDVDLLVRNFYRDAPMDDLLGPVFEAAHMNWDAHVATLIDFWCRAHLACEAARRQDGHP